MNEIHESVAKIDGAWIRHPSTQAVCTALEDAGHSALFVGGCVRNALIEAPVNDIDISTDAHPKSVMDIAKRAGFQAIPTGIDHGTITVVADGLAHEITTYRKDVATDGRRAVVEFATTIKQDALRRDFTMNALYADRRGDVFDPLGGLADLQNRLVRFIESPEQRIKEDYLRILRFFRFSSWYGNPEHGFDADTLDAIAQNIDGLGQLSKERITAEMLKLLTAPDPAPSIAAMRATGVLHGVLPQANDQSFALLVHLETLQNTTPNPIRRLANLCPSLPETCLRLSNAHRKMLDTISTAIQDMTPPHELGYRVGYQLAWDVILLRAALFETPIEPSQTQEARRGSEQKFPIKAADLMPEYTGVALGKCMKSLEKMWIASHFELSKADLLRSLNS